MRVKDMERSSKFENLELKAQVEFYKRIYEELRGRMESMERESV
jgi:hypothetical protein